MISDVDDDGSGTIGYEECLKMMTHKILNRDPKDEILKAFRLFDDDETGKISFNNLKRVAKELGERMTDEELQEMIDEADRDGDGEVNEEEFLRIMKKNQLVLSCTLNTAAHLTSNAKRGLQDGGMLCHQFGVGRVCAVIQLCLQTLRAKLENNQQRNLVLASLPQLK